MSYLTEKVRKERDRLVSMGVADSTLRDVLIKLEELDRQETVFRAPDELANECRKIAQQAIDGDLKAPETYNAVSGVYRSYIESLRQRLGIPLSEAEARQILSDHAKGLVKHTYNGLCPDALEGDEARDDKCRVCQALATLEAFGQ